LEARLLGLHVLDRDRLAQLAVQRLVHHAHPPRAQRADDLVAAKDGARGEVGLFHQLEQRVHPPPPASAGLVAASRASPGASRGGPSAGAASAGASRGGPSAGAASAGAPSPASPAPSAIAACSAPASP